MSKGARTSQSIIAVAKDDARFKAVEVREHDGVVELVWAKSLPAEERTWDDFAAECGLVVSADGRDKARRKHAPCVVGLDATGVVFYRISAPAVGAEETAAIVRMQAESLLPLPSDQIEVAWRTMPSRNGKADITIAASRKEYLQKFAGSVRGFRPRNILLSCEGTARAWQGLFSDRERQGSLNTMKRVGELRALVVSISAENAQVCLVQDGLVTQAAILDMGMAGLVSSSDAAERFAQDLRAVLGSFGWEESSRWPVLVLSDGRAAIERIVESLQAAGLQAKVAVPGAQGLRTPSGFETTDIYEYRVPLGLALTALDASSETLDLFQGIQGDEEKAGSSRYSLVLAGAAAFVMLIALVVAWRSVDVALAKRLDTQVADPNFEAARQHQALLKTVARHRPDFLQLLTDINVEQSEGIVLDGLHFKKGQAVAITGQAGNADQMYKFQTGLLAQKGITDVDISNSASDPKSKKIRFTITFHYRGFTKKEAIL